MLAEQHCVCTKSGLKNVFSTRCVVGRQRERGRRTFFLKMALEHSKSQHSGTSFLILSESAGSAARSPVAHWTLQRKLLTPRDSQSQNTACAIKKTTAKTCKEGGLMPADCLPSTHQTGSSRVCRNLLQPYSYKKKKKKIEKMCPFPVKKTKGLLPVAGTTPKPLSVLRSKSHLPEPTSSLAKHQAKFLTACQIYSVPQSSA